MLSGDVLVGVIRWTGLTAFAVLAGALALDLLLLPREDALAPARRRLGRWIDAAVGVLLVTSAGELIARAAVMAGAPAGRGQRVLARQQQEVERERAGEDGEARETGPADHARKHVTLS